MDALSRMIIEHDCERLVKRYAQTLDAYDYDAFLTLWAPDAAWIMLGEVRRGEEVIRKALDARDATMICRHLITNVIIEVEDADHARGHCYTLSFHVPGQRDRATGDLEPPTFVVEYRDRFVRDSARGWLFAERDITATLARGIG